jgi:flagellar basal body-associated protein FliL
MKEEKQTFQKIGFSKILLITLVVIFLLVGIIGGVLYLGKREIKIQPPTAQPPMVQPPTTQPPSKNY